MYRSGESKKRRVDHNEQEELEDVIEEEEVMKDEFDEYDLDDSNVVDLSKKVPDSNMTMKEELEKLLFQEIDEYINATQNLRDKWQKYEMIASGEPDPKNNDKYSNQSVLFKKMERYDFCNAPQVEALVVAPGQLPHKKYWLEMDDKFELRFIYKSGRMFTILLDKLEAKSLSILLAGDESKSFNVDNYGGLQITYPFEPQKIIDTIFDAGPRKNQPYVLLIESKLTFENIEPVICYDEKIAVLEAQIRDLKLKLKRAEL